MNLTTLLIQAICGAVGGNLGGLLNKTKSLGPLLNTFAGAIGGVGGGQVLGSYLVRLFSHATAWSLTTSTLGGLLLSLLVGWLGRRSGGGEPAKRS